MEISTEAFSGGFVRKWNNAPLHYIEPELSAYEFWVDANTLTAGMIKVFEKNDNAPIEPDHWDMKTNPMEVLELHPIYLPADWETGNVDEEKPMEVTAEIDFRGNRDLTTIVGVSGNDLVILKKLLLRYATHASKVGLSATQVISSDILGQTAINQEPLGEQGPEQNFADLLQFFNLRNQVEVEIFLSINPFIVPLLDEARRQIEIIFPETELLLDVVSDPEWAGNEQLILFISTLLSSEIASEKLDELDVKWWFANLDRSQGKLCISLEFL